MSLDRLLWAAVGAGLVFFGVWFGFITPTGAVVVTDRRVLFTRTAILGASRFNLRSIPIDDVVSVRHFKNSVMLKDKSRSGDIYLKRKKGGTFLPTLSDSQEILNALAKLALKAEKKSEGGNDNGTSQYAQARCRCHSISGY